MAQISQTTTDPEVAHHEGTPLLGHNDVPNKPSSQSAFWLVRIVAIASIVLAVATFSRSYANVIPGILSVVILIHHWTWALVIFPYPLISMALDILLMTGEITIIIVTYIIPWVDFGLGWDSVHLVAQVTALSTLLIALSILALLRINFLHCHRKTFLQHDQPQSGAADYLHAFISADHRKSPSTDA